MKNIDSCYRLYVIQELCPLVSFYIVIFRELILNSPQLKSSLLHILSQGRHCETSDQFKLLDELLVKYRCVFILFWNGTI